MNKKARSLLIFSVALFFLIIVSSYFLLAFVFAQGGGLNCWEIYDNETCINVSNCQWIGEGKGTGWCEKPGCWNFWDETNCSTAPGCVWDSAGNFCYEINCWIFGQTNCSAYAADGCSWKTSGYCYDPGCWAYGNNQNACGNDTAGYGNCAWDEAGNWCYEKGPWDIDNKTDCEGASYKWENWTWCYEPGCWDYHDNENCSADLQNYTNCAWNSTYSYCYEVGCWNYTTNTSCLAVPGCGWDSYENYCYEAEGCWNYGNYTLCNADAQNYSNCIWNGNETEGWCEEKGPWKYDDNQTACKNAGFNWTVESWCYEPGCWDDQNETSCTNDSLGYNGSGNCQWNSEYNFCEKVPMNCWNYSNNNSCAAANCSWSAGEGWCEKAGCWDYNYNKTGCDNATGCKWDNSTSMCNEVEWWNFNSTQCLAHNASGYVWKTESWGWCEEIGCWNWDNNKTGCLYAINVTGINCSWDGNNTHGWCYEVLKTCSELTNETECRETGWCIWNGTTCSEPEKVFMNPDCWAFPMETGCNNVSGCAWNGTTSKCDGSAGPKGVQCENITNNQQMCNKIPMLSSCCTWKNGTCIAAPYTTACWDNMQPPPEGAMFCEDYNAINSKTICNQIAGDPWYMPCEWNNITSKCQFKFGDMFAGTGGMGGFIDISTKKNCEFAGGIWKVEQWYDDISGTWKTDEWCEMGFGIGYETCDTACWACEFKTDGSKWSSASDAQTACEGSALGFCEWHSDSNAPNGQGWCGMKKEFMYGGGNCQVNCWDCDMMADPKTACENSKAGCKWFTDPMYPDKGWCDSKNIRTCEQDCFECYDNMSCTQKGLGGSGKCKWDSTSYLCIPSNFNNEICFDGVDNDKNGLVDCADPYCFFDPFCGGNMMSNCGMYPDKTGCEAATDCVWIKDPFGGQWCDMKGAQCWLYDSEANGCNTTNGCKWKSSDKGFKGFCDINESKAEKCFKKEKREICTADTSCIWKTDYSNPNGGFCDFKLFGCFEVPKANCGTKYTYCEWVTDPMDPFAPGKCVPKCFGKEYNENNASCLANANCAWIFGRCDTEMMMEDCFMYDGNQTECDLHNKSCAWHGKDEGMCDVDKSPNCPQYETEGACNADGNCTWTTDDGRKWCDNKLFSCFQYDYTNKTFCENHTGCGWFEDEQICDPLCFNGSLNSSECNALSGCMWSTGFCDPKMEGMMFMGMQEGPPISLGMDECPEGITQEIDICGMGMKDMPGSFGFGISVFNFANAAVCNGVKIPGGMGSGFEPAKFYLYLDTDGTSTNGCNASDEVGGEVRGFEFFFKYKTEQLEGGLSELKVAYKCVDSKWVVTKIPFSSWKEKMCGEINGGMIAIDKQALKKSELFHKTADLRIYVLTAGVGANEGSPVDSIGPLYYTPGSMDFMKEDCMMIGVDMDGDGFTSENDPDCQDFKRFGFQPFEFDCRDNIDNDGDGYIDENDIDCKFNPIIGGDFSFEKDVNDKTVPKVLLQRVDTFYDGAFISFDTDEPANGTVLFYYNASNCIADGTYNRTLIDVGDPAWTFDDYKPFHGIMIDNFMYNPDKLGYNLSNGTAYYYKYKVCDPSGNCATSACMKFTTKSSMREFFFKMDMPSGFPTPMFGDINMSGTKKLNETEGKRKDIIINCPSNGYSLTFVNASVKAAKTLNLSSVICDSTNNWIGMDSQVWNDLTASLNPEYILVTWAVGGESATIKNCNNTGGDCKDVTDYLNCTVTSSSVTCKIPVSLGFSVFAVYMAEVITPGGGDGGVPGGRPGCIENWSCTEWSVCVDRIQTRACTDLNACGTTLNKPAEKRSCTMPVEEEEEEEEKKEEVGVEKGLSIALLISTITAAVIIMILIFLLIGKARKGKARKARK